MRLERPEPHPVAVDLEVGPWVVAVFLERPVECVSRGRRTLGRRRLEAGGIEERPVRHDALGDESVEGSRRAALSDPIECVGAECAVAKPRVAVDGEVRRRDQAAPRALPLPEDSDASPHEWIVEEAAAFERRGHQPFSAPVARPLTNCRWNARKIAMTGPTAIAEAAKTRPQLVACWPWKRAIAIGSVRFEGSLMIVSAHANSSQLARKVKIATVASAGRESGRMSDRKRLHGPAPSTTIASSSSRGMSRKKLRSRKVLSARLPPV